MLKKALLVVMTFGTLLAGYAGYVRLFATIASGVGQTAAQRPAFRMRKETMSEQEARELAEEGFGPDHWAARRDVPLRFYNHEQRYWIYAKAYERLEGGRRLKFHDVVVISRSGDGKSLKCASSKYAILDLDQPLGLAKPGSGPIKVVHARMEGDVTFRDNKGTPRNSRDDLVIGPMPVIEYDEPALQVKSDSEIVIQDRDMRITGFGLLIQLRPKNEQGAIPDATSAGGFDAKSAVLYKDVHIVINDVGRSGILPGASPDGQPNKAGKVEERTPLELRSKGTMRVELPRRPKPVVVGPPSPNLPTLVYFNRDVVVKRGKPGQPPDQLDCDDLRLTLFTKPKEAPKAKAKGEAASPKTMNDKGGENGGLATADSATGAGTEMELREAVATGDIVWLQSKGQGITARCTELIHKKFPTGQPDETYLRGNDTHKLQVEKIETVQFGPDKGKPQSITVIRTEDATIFEDGKGSENATIVARGPGLLETRPSRDQPVERKALWQDNLVFLTEMGLNDQPTRKITLTGKSEVVDLAQSTLMNAEKEITAWLTPKSKAPQNQGQAPALAQPPTVDAGDGLVSTDTFQIRRLHALGNVHLISPGKSMTARDKLDAVFLEPEEPKAGEPAAKAKANANTNASAAASNAPNQPKPEPAPAQATPTSPDGKAAPKAPPKPREPEVSVNADVVWASIQLKPKKNEGLAQAQTRGESQAIGLGGDQNGGEVREVRLRGRVAFHQAPEPGKRQGTDVTGEAVDVLNKGDNKMLFVVQNTLEEKKPSKTEKAKAPHARVATEELTITGPHIGLDQSTDYAWVKGPGNMVQLASRGLLTEKGLDQPRASLTIEAENEKGKGAGQDQPETEKRPFTISWESEMKFLGRPSKVNLRGKPVALAQFHKNVRASMEDNQLSCSDRLDVYMDRQVSLARPQGKSSSPVQPGDSSDAKPQISLLDCFKDVVIESRKTEPNTGVLVQKSLIEAERVTFDKVTGNFHVPGNGLVTLWNREGKSDGPLGPGGGDTSTASRPRVRPTGFPSDGSATPSTRRATQVIGRNGSQLPLGNNGEIPPNLKRGGAEKLPLKVTVISFTEEMVGRYVAGKDRDTTETRWATFLGDVETLNATVPSENTKVDFDHLPSDHVYLTSQKMDVSSTPSPEKGGTAKNFLMAVKEAQAKTRTETIKADIIKYDSEKELFYAYSEEGRASAIVRQDSIGQPITSSQGMGLQYNRKTGQSQYLVPMSPIEFVQANTGTRPGPAPEAKGKAIKAKRNGPGHRIPTPSQTERRGMSNGR